LPPFTTHSGKSQFCLSHFTLFASYLYSCFNQKLNNNWRFGKGEVREIDLSKWLNLENVYLMGEMDQEYISYLLAMDSKQIFIGFMTGNIMIFDRKTLQLLKVFWHIKHFCSTQTRKRNKTSFPFKSFKFVKISIHLSLKNLCRNFAMMAILLDFGI